MVDTSGNSLMSFNDKYVKLHRGAKDELKHPGASPSADAEQREKLERELELAQGAVEWLLKRIFSLPMSRSFLDVTIILLDCLDNCEVFKIITDETGRNLGLRRSQKEIASVVSRVAPRLPAFTAGLIRGEHDPWKTYGLPDPCLAILPDTKSLKSQPGMVVIRNALKRDLDKHHKVQEAFMDAFCADAAEQSMYEREQKSERQRTTTKNTEEISGSRQESVEEGGKRIGGLPPVLETTATKEFARASRSRSPSPSSRRTGRSPSPSRSRPPSAKRQVDDNDDRSIPAKLLENVGYEDIFLTEPVPVPTVDESPAEERGQLENEDGLKSPTKVTNQAGDENRDYKNPISKGLEKQGLDQEQLRGKNLEINTASPSVESPVVPSTLKTTPPLTPAPASPASASLQPAASRPDPLGSMFAPALDKRGAIAVVKTILCSASVLNDHRKAARVLKALENGRVDGETMEWIVRGLRSKRGQRELAQRDDGLEFVGPQWGAPMYKTGNGMYRLLRGLAAKHESGTKFMVCASFNSSGPKNIGITTGVLRKSSTTTANEDVESARAIEPVIYGKDACVEDWVSSNGNMDNGPRLWAWIY